VLLLTSAPPLSFEGDNEFDAFKIILQYAQDPNEYIVHLLMEGGHGKKCAFPTFKSFRSGTAAN